MQSQKKDLVEKNEYGFPKKSIDYCLKSANINKHQIDFVAVATLNLPPKYFAE